MKSGYLPYDQTPHYVFGLDIGSKRNHTALVTLQKRWNPATVEEIIASANNIYYGEWIYTIVQAKRLPLGVPYTEIAHWVKDEIAKVFPPFHKTLVMDATGVGSAVCDLLREMDIGARMAPVVITGGDAAGRRSSGSSVHLSRTELMTSLRLSVERQQFSILKTCTEAEALRGELKALRMQGKPEHGQDDLAFSAALTVWWALRS